MAMSPHPAVAPANLIIYPINARINTRIDTHKPFAVISPVNTRDSLRTRLIIIRPFMNLHSVNKPSQSIPDFSGSRECHFRNERTVAGQPQHQDQLGHQKTTDRQIRR